MGSEEEKTYSGSNSSFDRPTFQWVWQVPYKVKLTKFNMEFKASKPYICFWSKALFYLLNALQSGSGGEEDPSPGSNTLNLLWKQL